MTDRQIDLLLFIYRCFRENNQREFMMDLSVEGIREDLLELHEEKFIRIRKEAGSVMAFTFLSNGIEPAERYRRLMNR